MNPVTKVNGELPFKEPELIVLTIEDAKTLDRLIKRVNDDIVLTGTESVSWMTLQVKIKQAEK